MWGDMHVGLIVLGVMFVMVGDECYFVGSPDVRDFLGWVMCDVVSE